MDFDVDVFARWIISIRPEYVWLGFNSKSNPKLPEPTPEKLRKFVARLLRAGIPIRGKTLRGMKLGIHRPMRVISVREPGLLE